MTDSILVDVQVKVSNTSSEHTYTATIDGKTGQEAGEGTIYITVRGVSVGGHDLSVSDGKFANHGQYVTVEENYHSFEVTM